MVKCTWCGKKISRQPSDLRKFKNSFCSKSCQRQWKMNVWEYPKIEVDTAPLRKLKELSLQVKKKEKRKVDPVIAILPDRFFNNGGMNR